MASQYYFDELDPTTFQRLINALLVHRYGEGIRLLPLRGKDGGKDAETPINSWFFGVTIPSDPGSVNPSPIKPGRYLFQVKHHRMLDRPGASSRSAVLQDFGSELEKNVLTRLGDDRVDHFFLITNVPSSREIIQKVDEKRLELLRNLRGPNADVLWQEHITAWLDQAASVWAAFPDLFAGKIVPALGLIAGSQATGLPMSIKRALRAQFDRDSIVRFRQVNLEQDLPRLFVDLDAFPASEGDMVLFVDKDGRRYGSVVGLGNEYVIEQPSDTQAGASPRSGVLRLLLSESDRKRSKIILEGGPGQGKSTVTQMLAQVYRSLLLDSVQKYRFYSAAVPAARLPFRVELRLFAEWLGTTDRSIEQYLSEVFSKDSGGATVSVEDICHVARGQGLILIFDGLDEVGSDTLRDLVVTKIVESISRFETDSESDVRAIVTSRPPAIAGRADSLNGFRRLLLQPLSDSRINDYVERWTQVQCTDRPDRERVASSFSKRRSEAHVAALAKNPMQLSVLLHFIRLKGEAFPDKRAELYREYFKTVIDRDVEKSPELRLHRDDIETLHEVIGFAIQSRAEGNQSAARLSRPALMALVRGWLQLEDRHADLGEKLFKIGEERLGLIVALSGEGALTHYGFEIQPVREYFAAAFINDKCEADAHELFESMVRRTFWREVARFLAGLRRANERADLLSRARQLDQDTENGWRSDGLTVAYQLLQEGVLTAPGNVHREALSFLISGLDASQPKARLEPSDLVSNLPRLILGCDSDHPKDVLRELLRKSCTLDDRRDLRRLWSVCYRVFAPDEIVDAMLAYAGPADLKAMIKLRWPAESGLSFFERLRDTDISLMEGANQLAEHWYAAGCLDESVRNFASTPVLHEGLLEEFAFRGIYHCDPKGWQRSQFAIWQLGGHLREIGLALAVSDGESGESNSFTDFSGIPDSCLAPLKEILGMAKAASAAPKGSQERKIKQFVMKLAEIAKSEGFMSLVASRCATTLLAYADRPRHLTYQDMLVWRGRGRTSPVIRTKAWRDLKLALIPLFRAGVPDTRDRLGRIYTNALVNRGFHRRIQSHTYFDGNLVEIISLLTDADGGVRSPSLGWLSRIPIQQYWLGSFLTEDNVECVLTAISRQPLEWSGPFLPLTAAQAGYIATILKQDPQLSKTNNPLFALRDSRMWVHVREPLLSSMLSHDSRNSGHSETVFESASYSPAKVPVALMKSASKILTGELAPSSSISSAAAGFTAKRNSLSLPPLRESGAFPAWRGFAGSS